MMIAWFGSSLIASADSDDVQKKLKEQEEMIRQLYVTMEAQKEEISALKAKVHRMEGNQTPGHYERDASGKIVWSRKDVAAEKGKSGFLSKYGVKFYGYIKADAAYDSSQMHAGNFGHYVLREKDTSGDQFSLTGNQTRFGFDIGDLAVDDAAAKIEVDFYGSNSPANKAKLRMRHAYVKWNAGDWVFTAGQTTDTIAQAVPNSIDFGYYHNRGKIGYRSPQIIAMRKVKIGETLFSPTLAISRTEGKDYDGDGQNDGADAGFPTAQWALPLTGDWFGNGTAKLSVQGHYGVERVDAPAHFVDGNLETWSLGGSWILPLTKSLVWKGTVWTGANLDFYLGGIGQGVDAAKGDVIEASGGWTQLGLKVSPKVTFNIGGGIDNPEDEDLSEGKRAENTHVSTNIYYDLEQGVQLGIEYQKIWTKYVGYETAKNDRVQGTVIYKF